MKTWELRYQNISPAKMSRFTGYRVNILYTG